MAVHLANENALLAEARVGNAEAFGTLVNQYYPNIYRLALQITGNREDAEDALQDAVLKAYVNLGQFRGNSRFYTWLVRIALNQALMKLRKRRSGKEVPPSER
jgi:RNA polymerase sigma-70 factor (ECF subfamily)